VYVPATNSPHGGRSLLVVLHGCAQGNTPLQGAGGFAETAEALGMVIALPAKGGFPGCWEYFSPSPSRTTGDNGAVIGVAQALMDDPAAGIAPSQVYLAGFSSGGGLAVILGCIAPDIFAGVGIVAGPSLGGGVGLGMETDDQCRDLAGEFAGDFGSQLAVAFASSDDGIVAPNQAEINRDMFEAVYAETALATAAGTLDITQFAGASPTGDISVWYDEQAPRLLHVTTTGTGHNWPGGTGQNGTYVYGGGLDFGRFLGDFFTDNNLRVDGNVAGGGPWGDPPGAPGGDDDDDDDDAGTGGTPGDDDGDDGDDDPDDGGGDDGDDAADDDDDDGGGTGSLDDGGDDDDDDSDASDDDGAGLDEERPHVPPTGCQCTAGESGGSTVWLWLALFGVCWRRPRRG